MTKKGNINILIDGPSRSGKLLLAKLILASPRLAFQHYSGDAERILEAIYMSRKGQEINKILIELLRVNLVHTIEDLKSCRQLSINRADSSYYKKSSFYGLNKRAFEEGKAIEIIKREDNGFIIHTHESEKFINHMRANKQWKIISNTSEKFSGHH